MLKQVILLGVGCMAWTSASALSCAQGPVASMPQDGATAVPVNGVIAVWHSMESPEGYAPRLMEVVSGETVPVQTELVEDSGDMARYIPQQALKPNTEYAFHLDRNDEGDQAFMAFTTGDVRDDVAPDRPLLGGVKRSHEPDGDWGPVSAVDIDLTPADEPVYYRVELSTGDTFENAEASTVMARPDGTLVSVDRGMCAFTFDMDAMDVAQVRVMAIDLAGNASEVSEPAVARGCSSLGLVGVGWLGLGVFPVLLGRKRRKS